MTGRQGPPRTALARLGAVVVAVALAGGCGNGTDVAVGDERDAVRLHMERTEGAPPPPACFGYTFPAAACQAIEAAVAETVALPECAGTDEAVLGRVLGEVSSLIQRRRVLLRSAGVSEDELVVYGVGELLREATEFAGALRTGCVDSLADAGPRLLPCEVPASESATLVTCPD